MIDSRPRASLHRLALLAALALTLALPALGATSTMGFTRQFYFAPTTGPNLHWISLPRL